MTVVWSVATTSGVGSVFAASFASKVRHPVAWRSYLESIRRSRAVPQRLAAAAATGLAAAEVATVCLLVPPAGRTSGLLLGLLLSVLLTVGVGAAVARHSSASCQCFGAGDRLGTAHLARNAVLTICIGAGLLVRLAAPPGAGRWQDALAGGLIGVGLAAVVVGWEDIGWALTALRREVRP